MPVLIPELRRRHPGATVLMDNLSAHKPKAIESALTSAGFTLLYLPRYSPDLSPIEPGWSKLKSRLRTAEARTAEALETALAPALDSITPADARGWFNHCGYAVPNCCAKLYNSSRNWRSLRAHAPMIASANTYGRRPAAR